MLVLWGITFDFGFLSFDLAPTDAFQTPHGTVKLVPGANQVVVRVNFENQSETLSRPLIRQRNKKGLLFASRPSLVRTFLIS